MKIEKVLLFLKMSNKTNNNKSGKPQNEGDFEEIILSSATTTTIQTPVGAANMEVTETTIEQAPLNSTQNVSDQTNRIDTEMVTEEIDVTAESGVKRKDRDSAETVDENQKKSYHVTSGSEANVDEEYEVDYEEGEEEEVESIDMLTQKTNNSGTEPEGEQVEYDYKMEDASFAQPAEGGIHPSVEMGQAHQEEEVQTPPQPNVPPFEFDEGAVRRSTMTITRGGRIYVIRPSNEVVDGLRALLSNLPFDIAPVDLRLALDAFIRDNMFVLLSVLGASSDRRNTPQAPGFDLYLALYQV